MARQQLPGVNVTYAKATANIKSDRSGSSSLTTKQTSESPKDNATSNKSKVLIPPHKKDTRKLFVGGLSRYITNETFEEFFGNFGTVLDSVVMIEPKTQRHRGFGFVTFEDPLVARTVLASGNEGKDPPLGGFTSGKVEILGRLCEVKASEPKKGTGSTRCSSHAKSAGPSIASSASSNGLGLIPQDIQFQAGLESRSVENDYMYTTPYIGSMNTWPMSYYPNIPSGEGMHMMCPSRTAGDPHMIYPNGAAAGFYPHMIYMNGVIGGSNPHMIYPNVSCYPPPGLPVPFDHMGQPYPHYPPQHVGVPILPQHYPAQWGYAASPPMTEENEPVLVPSELQQEQQH